MREKCIVYISSTNYKIVSAGTEKFISEIIDAYKDRGIHSIQMFPLTNFNEKVDSIGMHRNFIGINYDGTFVGVYCVTDIFEAINYLCKKYELQCEGIIINQLHHWMLINLADELLKIKLPIYVHDYMMVCPYLMFQDGNGIRCGLIIERPSNKHCLGCQYLERGIDHFDKIKIFFSKTYHLIKKVIFPSRSAKKNWLSVFPEFEKVSCIRPHLTYTCVRANRKLRDKVRIAYLGYISEFKGYSEWIKLIEKLDKSRFEIYYFGSYVEQAEKDGAKSILVDFNKSNLPSMAEQLEKNRIDIAFLWSNCQETYSYTYYEAFEAGCWIITSKHSGNIVAQVNYNNNGIAFDKIDDCITYLSNFQDEVPLVKANNVLTNTNFSEFNFPNSIDEMVGKVKRPYAIISFLYRHLRSE